MNRSAGRTFHVRTLTGLLAVTLALIPAGASTADDAADGSRATATVPPKARLAAPPGESRYWLSIGINNGGLDWPPAYVVLLNCDPAVPPVAPPTTCAKLAAIGGDLSRLVIPHAICTLEYRPYLTWGMGKWGGRAVGSNRAFGNLCWLHTGLAGIVPPRDLPPYRPPAPPRPTPRTG